MNTAIRKWVIQTMMKGQTGVVQTLPKKDLIELNVQITVERMLRNGVNPNDMKTVGQVENVVEQIDTRKVNVNPGITSVKKADVLDMEGNKISDGSQIIGGKEINQKNLNKELMKTDNPYSDLVNTPRPKTLAERKAEVLARLEKENTETAQRIRDRKKAELENRSLEDYVDDVGGVNPDDPRGIDDFIPDPEEKADGGRIGLFAGSTKIPAVISALLKNKKKVNQAANNIFPTGDYKLDAEMVAESIVELNPKPFNNMLYDDLDNVTRSEIYGAALSEVSKKNALMLQMKKATKPEKTLQSMKEGKGINMSDPEIAKEFARFMKQTDPKGTKDIEEKIILESFDPKRTKGNADGGRIGLKTGMGKAFIEFFKNMTKPKPRPEFNVEKFRKGPVNLDFLENIDKKDLEPFIRSRDTGGPGSYGMYDNFDDMPVGLQAAELISRIRTKDGRINYEAAELFMGKKLKGNETVDELIQMVTEKEMKADGGRIGLKAGMTKRAFLKLMGSVGLGVGAAKSGIFSIGKGATKQVAKEVAQQTTSSMPPPYFFKLAEKIKMMGDDITAKSATKDREVVTKFKEYEMTEDVATGEIQIMKSGQSDEALDRFASESANEEVFMRYKPGKGQADETTKGKTIPDEYEENTSYISNNRGDTGGILEELDGVPDDILKEVGEAKSIKRASGGLAYMLGE